MGVPVGELQYGTVLDGHVRPRRTMIGRRLGLRQKNFFFVADRNVITWVASRSVQEARLKTNKWIPDTAAASHCYTV